MKAFPATSLVLACLAVHPATADDRAADTTGNAAVQGVRSTQSVAGRSGGCGEPRLSASYASRSAGSRRPGTTMRVIA